MWVRTHQERFWSITGTVAMVALFLAFIIHHQETENDEAWTQLGLSQSYIMQSNWDGARKSLDQWNIRFSRTKAAPYAKFMMADLLYKTSDYAAAQQAYGQLAETAHPSDMRPLALSAKITSEEMAGHPDAAKIDAQNFLTQYPDHFMAASIYMTQARLAEKSGDLTQATALYERFALLYPQSPWTAMVQARLATLRNLSTPPAAK